MTAEDVARLFDVPLAVLGPRQPGRMANAKNTPKQSPAEPEVDMAEVEKFALARGQRINNGIDSGVIQAYLDDKARREAGTQS